MGRYVRKMQLMLTSMANIPVQTNIWDQDETAPMRSGSVLIASKTSFNNELVDSDFIWDFGKLPFPSQLGKYIIKFGKIVTKIHEIGKIKAIFGLGMTPI